MSSHDIKQQKSITVFTIGFSKRSARQFFRILQQAGVKKVVDIRLNNISQLAGFTKKEDLEFFLHSIAGIEYKHHTELAPTKEILNDYKKKKISWPEYEERFSRLMIERQIENIVGADELDHACLLCSEPKADKCHRRLVAEYLQSKWDNMEIRHL